MTLLVNIFIFILKITRGIYQVAYRGSLIILPPANIGSLGDEAIVLGVMNYFGDKNISKYGLITYRKESYASLEQRKVTYINFEKFFKGDWLGQLSAVWSLSCFESFYCLGADVLDGFYSEKDSCRRLELIRLASKLGLRTSVIGFSFNESNSVKCIEAFKRLPASVRICCRDKASGDRLSKAINREVICSGDPAFFLKPQEDSENVKAVKAWVEERRKNGQMVMGINLNALHRRFFPGQDFVKMVERHIDILTALRKVHKGVSFVFMSHDNRGEINDFGMAVKVHKRLDQDTQEDCLLAPDNCTAAEIKAICGLLDVVFTGRFHLAVACFGQGTPVSMIDYQGKVGGITQFLGVGDAVIDMQELVAGHSISEKLAYLIRERQALKKNITRKLPELLKMVERNFV